MQNKSNDVVIIGRAAVDLYSEQNFCDLKTVSSFAKYVGGAGANIAIGAARLGLRTAIITCVGDDAMGHFVRDQLQGEKVDIRSIRLTPNKLTALVLLAMQSPDSFPHMFYRENCADMDVQISDIDTSLIAATRVLVITGTHLSTPQTRAASHLAATTARANNTRVVLDIDYRPSLWGAVPVGQGDARSQLSQNATSIVQEFLPLCDLVVGTEEEFCAATGAHDGITALHAAAKLCKADLVLKRGAHGSVVLTPSAAAPIEIPTQTVHVVNSIGAGDAFLSALLYRWLHEDTWEQACAFANASGALVVTRRGCAPAMPSRIEIDSFLNKATPHQLEEQHLITTQRASLNNICLFAFDHRAQLADWANGDHPRITHIKNLLFKALKTAQAKHHGKASFGLIIDDRYGADVLAELSKPSSNFQAIARPVERPNTTPLQWAQGLDIGLSLKQWPSSHMVKCLLRFDSAMARPIAAQQILQAQTLFEACRATGHALLLELLPSSGALDPKIADAIDELYAVGIRPDYWKIPPPAREVWGDITQVIAAHDPHCNGVLLLGGGKAREELTHALRLAREFPICKGFAVGRTLFEHPVRDYLKRQLTDAELIEQVSTNLLQLVGDWEKNEHHGPTAT